MKIKSIRIHTHTNKNIADIFCNSDFFCLNIFVDIFHEEGKLESQNISDVTECNMWHNYFNVILLILIYEISS